MFCSCSAVLGDFAYCKEEICTRPTDCDISYIYLAGVYVFAATQRRKVWLNFYLVFCYKFNHMMLFETNTFIHLHNAHTMYIIMFYVMRLKWISISYLLHFWFIQVYRPSIFGNLQYRLVFISGCLDGFV